MEGPYRPPREPGATAKPPDLRARILTMPDTLPINSMPSVFSPLAKALLDGFSDGVVVFDAEGRLLYTNQPAREALAGMDLFEGAPDLQPRLAALGGPRSAVRAGGRA